jgi:hypothetical protein
MENYNANEASGYEPLANTSTAHIWRYYLARGFIEPGDTVNDVACGWGYGSAILARSTAKIVRGFDYDLQAIVEARLKYDSDTLVFTHQDFDKDLSLPMADLSVSIETIEHLVDPQAFADALKLSTRRYIFLTAPIVPTTQAALGDDKGSPYHHHDFSLTSLDNLFAKDGWQKIGDSEQGRRHGIIVYFNQAYDFTPRIN